MLTDTTKNQTTQNKIIHPSAMGATLPLGRVLLLARRGAFILTLLLSSSALPSSFALGKTIDTRKTQPPGVADTSNDSIDWDRLISAVIEVESGGDSNAVSKDGCIGLMQVSPIVLREYIQYKEKEFWKEAEPFYQDGMNKEQRFKYAQNNLFKPEYNKKVGSWYLRRLEGHYLKDKYTMERLLCAWNGGITRLKKVNYDCSKMPNETKKFTKKVLKIYEKSLRNLQ